ncbi:hypothetical protein P2G88_04230 [Aliiglaciecola sp. CAU 1673]|uniref:hypothetical protein n=1 Tax=Aliiglaciecola sp. CAU 1673 TaxID=3032595 RepID=UPI0023D99938|nr:hypothetical protein [Aliiglaciecola sp. CAU 1673]MDF2177452.1 hypothetical protein [Aliiglaciecola sp. CAU 1673]
MMKKAVRLAMQNVVAGLIAGVCSTGAFAAPVEEAKAVFVGHSLINYEMPHMLAQMATSQGLSLHKAVQVNNGTPLRVNWETCHSEDFQGRWPPQDFACDAIESVSGENAYDVLVVTDANNSIHSNHVWNHTQVYLEQFTELLLSKNPQGRSFLFTSWEGLYYHNGEWLDAVNAELAEYEEIAAEAEALSAERGRHANIQVIPVNLALKTLIHQIEQGQIAGLENRTDLFSDAVHMNATGNYFVAAVVYSAIYGQSPEGASTRMLDAWGNVLLDMPVEQARILQTLAWDVVAEYYGFEGSEPDESPAPLSDLSATPNPQNWGIDLNWTPPSVPLQYYKLSANGQVLTAVNGQADSFSLSWLAQRVEHQIHLAAYDFSHQLVAEAVVSSYAGDHQPPSVPQGLSLSQEGEYGLSLSWQASSDDNSVAKYLIFRNGQAYTHVIEPGFVDPWPPATVSYHIVAVDFHGNHSAPSETVSRAD